MFKSCFSLKSGSIDWELFDREQIDYFDIETIIRNTNLNNVLTDDLRQLKDHIVNLRGNQITSATFQELAGMISSISPTEVWGIFFACMKNSPSNIQTDFCCRKNLLSTVFSNNVLKDIPRLWSTVFLCDMCRIHCSIDASETSRILLYMFTKLPEMAPAISTEISTLHSVIDKGICKFISLGTPFWNCPYFGNSRLIWLGTATDFMTSGEATNAFECIIKSMQWDLVTEEEVHQFEDLPFTKRIIQASNSFHQQPPSVVQSGIRISIGILAFLFENVDHEFRQLPYIYYLISKSDVQFKVDFLRVYKLKDWRRRTVMRLSDYIRKQATNISVTPNQFVYAVGALYFIWNRGDAIHLDEVANYIRTFRAPATLLYDGGNLVASYHVQNYGFRCR